MYTIYKNINKISIVLKSRLFSLFWKRLGFFAWHRQSVTILQLAWWEFWKLLWRIFAGNFASRETLLYHKKSQNPRKMSPEDGKQLTPLQYNQ